MKAKNFKKAVAWNNSRHYRELARQEQQAETDEWYNEADDEAEDQMTNYTRLVKLENDFELMRRRNELQDRTLGLLSVFVAAIGVGVASMALYALL